MAGLGTVTIAPVQAMAGVTHGFISSKLLMVSPSVDPIRRGFITGRPEVTGAAVGYKVVAVSTG